MIGNRFVVVEFLLWAFDTMSDRSTSTAILRAAPTSDSRPRKTRAPGKSDFVRPITLSASSHQNLQINGEKVNNFGDCSEAYKGAKVLVLGASGFIGRWTARKLSAAGAELFLPVRKMSAARSVFDEYGIEGMACEVDLVDTNGIGELISRIQPSVIFDLAGYGIDRTEKAEDIAYHINARLPEILCLSMKESTADDWPGQKIVRAGTAMEYGAVAGNLVESSTPHPTTVYGKSKVAGTLNLARWCEKLGLKGLTARLFSVYGAGEHPGRLLPTLIRASESDEPIELTAGCQNRDFIYVEDAAEGLLRLGLTSADRCDVVNVATGALTSVREFAEIAADELAIAHERLKFGALATRPEEMRHEPVSIARLRDLTGWYPQTRIAEGVRRTLEFS